MTITQISRREYDRAMGELPPMLWTTHDGRSVWCCPEMLTGSLTTQYCETGRGEYYTATVDVDDTSTWIDSEKIDDCDAQSEMLEALEEYGEPLEALLNDGYNLDDAIDLCRNHYCGHYDDREDYAIQYINDTGALRGMPENLRCYFDYEAFARDCFISDVFDVDAHDGGIFVFYR